MLAAPPLPPPQKNEMKLRFIEGKIEYSLILTLNWTHLTHYTRYCFSVPPEKIRKPKGFLMFSGGIEKQH